MLIYKSLGHFQANVYILIHVKGNNSYAGIHINVLVRNMSGL